MSDLANTIGIAVVTNGALLGLFIWVFKKLFETSLAERTKAYQTEIELINKKNFHQYSKVFDKQAEVIESVYSDLVKLSDQVAYLAFHFDFQDKHPELFQDRLLPKDGDPIQWERYHRAIFSEKIEDTKANELSEHASSSLKEFRAKRIYFTNNVADEIERYINLVLFVSSQFSNVNFRDPKDFKTMVDEKVVTQWIQAINVSGSLFPILENTFRGHLGVR